MPRLRAPASSSASAPAELRDNQHPVWADPDSTRAWLRVHGLPVFDRIEHGPNTRFVEAVKVWAVAHGLTRTYGEGTYPFPDFTQLRTAGVDRQRGTGRERMIASGATFDSMTD